MYFQLFFFVALLSPPFGHLREVVDESSLMATYRRQVGHASAASGPSPPSWAGLPAKILSHSFGWVSEKVRREKRADRSAPPAGLAAPRRAMT